MRRDRRRHRGDARVDRLAPARRRRGSGAASSRLHIRSAIETPHQARICSEQPEKESLKIVLAAGRASARAAFHVPMRMRPVMNQSVAFGAKAEIVPRAIVVRQREIYFGRGMISTGSVPPSPFWTNAAPIKAVIEELIAIFAITPVNLLVARFPTGSTTAENCHSRRGEPRRPRNSHRKAFRSETGTGISRMGSSPTARPVPIRCSPKPCR